jgi:hypothetical protein
VTETKQLLGLVVTREVLSAWALTWTRVKAVMFGDGARRRPSGAGATTMTRSRLRLRGLLQEICNGSEL